MRLNKKFLSCFTALTMAVAPMTAFAASESHEITGSGQVGYLETEHFNMVLPTNDAIKFTVDPYGVLTGNGNDTLENIMSASAGTVTSSATAVINKSSFDVDVKIGLLFDSTAASNGSVKLGTKAEAEAGTADLYLAVEQLSGASLATVTTGGAATVTFNALVPSGSGTTLSEVTKSAATLSTAALDLTGSAITTGAITPVTATNAASLASSAAVEFTLKNVAYAYMVSGTSVTLSEAAVNYTTDNTYVFAITGHANPKSDVWKQLEAVSSSALSLTMKFTLTQNSGTPTYTDGDTVAWVADGSDFVFKHTHTGKTLTKVEGKYKTKWWPIVATETGGVITMDSDSTENAPYLDTVGTQLIRFTYIDGSIDTLTVKVTAAP